MKRGLVEIATGGTLFLDEIAEMNTKLQAKLLRFLQERTYRRVGGTADQTADVRVVAATHAKIDSRVESGAFREDLFHRLNQVTIELPALRARKQDLMAMATEFATRAFKARGKEFPGFEAEAENAIRQYRWPGNVRELINIVDRVALIATGHGKVTAAMLGIPGVRLVKDAVTVNEAQTEAESVGVHLSNTLAGADASTGSYTQMKKRKNLSAIMFPPN
jgi:transcriptional regulator with PAS, ATPase and Fis domain